MDENGKFIGAHSAVCVFCNKSIKSGEACSFVTTYYDEYTENGIDYTYEVHTCRNCQSTVSYRYWTQKGKGCQYEDYVETTVNGVTTTEVVSRGERHNFSYVHNGIGDEGFAPTHSYSCTDCGYTEGSTDRCDWYSGYYYSYTVNGIV